MNDSILLLTGTLSGDQVVSIVKIAVLAGTALAITYGAYEKGYHMKGKAFGVELEITPA